MVRYEVPMGHPAFGKLFRCPQYRADYDAERREKLLKLSNLHVFVDKTFQTFEVNNPRWTTVEQASLEFARDAALRFAYEPEGWLLLEGTYGCGKTHLAAAVGNARLAAGDSVLFITSPDLLDYLRMTFAPSSEVTYDEMFDRIRAAGLLIIDDLGVEKPSEWALEKLFQLLNYRYSRQLPTVITTNANLDLLDPRLRSRLLDTSIVHHIKLKTPDFRTSAQSERDELINMTPYSAMRFDNFDTQTNLSREDRDNLERVLAASQSYAHQPEGWLVLLGAYGSGKTHLAAAIANHQQTLGTDVMFVTVTDLLDYLRMTFHPDAPASFEQRFYNVRNAPLLVLDDLGLESASAWAKEKLFQIINHRYVARRPTVITTSKQIGDIDERIRSRLLDRRLCFIFAITAPAYVTRLYQR
jgi:DNA replication protein DnaC